MGKIIAILLGGNVLLDIFVLLVVGAIIWTLRRPSVRQWWNDCKRDFNAIVFGHFGE